MTKTHPGEAPDPLGEIELARRTFQYFKRRILDVLEAVQDAPPDETLAKEIRSASKAYEQTLLQLSKQETELEKHSTAIRGVLRGGAIDLDAARDEVVERIARLRDARAD